MVKIIQELLVKCEQCNQEEYIVNKEDLDKNPNCVCKKCQVINRAATIKQNKSKIFVERAALIHQYKYSYDKTVYIGVYNKIIIVCPEHGEFAMRPNSHLNGQGCPKCRPAAIGDSKRKTTEEFIENAKKKHGDKYDYSLVDYKGNNKKVTIICPEHGEFEQTPNGHLNGNKCKKCDTIREDNVLYIWRVPNTNNYKIGITSDRLEDDRMYIVARGLSKGLNYKVIPECVFKLKIENALEVEKQLLNKFTLNPYNDMSIDGKTEFRTLTTNELKESINLASSFI
jgi:hypothetical protein